MPKGMTFDPSIGGADFSAPCFVFFQGIVKLHKNRFSRRGDLEGPGKEKP